MKTLTVDLPGRAYDIQIERGLLARAGQACRAVLPRAARLAVVSDETVAPLYAERLLDSLRRSGFAPNLITVPTGEASKSMTTLEYLYDTILSAGFTRTDAIVALGGGVVGDLAGFAAATILRGVAYVQIPTTLLAQVDSSVGGKVAVNVKAGKNLAGAFWQPRLVLMDPDCLETLADSTFSDGMAEVIKYGCISDAAFFARLEASPTRAAVMADIEEILYTCCDCKRAVVVDDERDTGVRMVLNFGHTLGHAYELAGGYAAYTHGQAVAAGMCRAAELGVTLGITPSALPERIAALVRAFSLPDFIPCTQAQYAAAIGLDKKGAGDKLSLIVLEALGRAGIHEMGKAELLNLIGACAP